MPKVSIIIPTFNGEHFIARAIKSVLYQTYQDFELIIVDDASTDNTEKVIKRFNDKRIIYIKHKENSGAPAKPKNTGLKHARGRYIAFLDHDDEWLPEKLEKQTKILDDSLEIGAVSCYVFEYYVDSQRTEEKKIKRPKNLSEDYLRILHDCFIWSSTSVVIRREIFDKVGFFDEYLRISDDWDMWIRIMKYYKFDLVPEFLFKYYVHTNNLYLNTSLRARIREKEYMFNKHLQEYKNHPLVGSLVAKNLAFLFCFNGNMDIGRKYYIKSIKLNSVNFKSYLYFLISFFGRTPFQWRKALAK